MQKKICIQGLGFVGSAMAAAVSLSRNAKGQPHFNVVGVELDTEKGVSRVNSINKGAFPFETSDNALIAAMKMGHRTGNLSATTDPSNYQDADIIVVDIDLDIPFLENEPQLELKKKKKAIRTIGMRMNPNALIIIETTVPPGTCMNVVYPVLVEEFTKRGLSREKIKLAHSYERVMPGKNYLDSIVNIWRVYSGDSIEAANECEDFLTKVINVSDFPLTRLSSTTASETAKVLENTYRAMNIAFMCEWTRFAEKVNLDLFEIIAAIQKRPTHANLRYPGLGIGGYCLTKDPAFAPAAAKQLFNQDLDFPFSNLAIKEAAKMPTHGVDSLVELLDNKVEGKRILICGVSYRQDVADTRYSPSETVYIKLKEMGALVSCHDPYVEFWDEMKIDVLSSLPPCRGYDAVLFAIPHSEYMKIDLLEWVEDYRATKILDCFMVFSSEERRRCRQQGLDVNAIGVARGL